MLYLWLVFPKLNEDTSLTNARWPTKLFRVAFSVNAFAEDYLFKSTYIHINASNEQFYILYIEYLQNYLGSTQVN